MALAGSCSGSGDRGASVDRLLSDCTAAHVGALAPISCAATAPTGNGPAQVWKQPRTDHSPFSMGLITSPSSSPRAARMQRAELTVWLLPAKNREVVDLLTF